MDFPGTSGPEADARRPVVDRQARHRRAAYPLEPHVSCPDCAGDRLISRIIHSNPSVKYYMQRPELASLLGRSLLIASFEQDKDGKQRYWEVRTTGPPGSRFYPGGYY